MKYIIIILLIFLIAVLLVLLESKRECRKVRETKYNIKSDKLTGDKAGLRIVMLSDLHNTVFPKNNKAIWDIIERNNPDAIVVAGDILVSKDSHYNKNIKSADFVNQLAGYAPVYYGLGNHERAIFNSTESNLWDEYKSRLVDNVRLLIDEEVTVYKEDAVFNLYGLNLSKEYYRRFKKKKLNIDDINLKLGTCDKDKYNILIGHNPDYFEEYAEWGADLILAGHNHGGLVRLPVLGGVISPRFNIFPKYDYGMFKKGKSLMILSNGLGAHTLKIRVNNIPEIAVIDINQQ